MRIQLIQPPQRISATNYVSVIAIPPLGLAYLASSLEAAGHKVSVIDGVAGGFNCIQQVAGQTLRGMPFEQIVEQVDPQADIIGLGIMFSSSWPSLRQLVRQLKQRWPDKLLVIGGEHATSLPELILDETPADLCVMGEGEQTIVELCNRLQQNQSIDFVAGIARRMNGKVVRNPRRERIREVDAIPLPAWHHFDIEGYIAFRQPHGSADGRSMPMLATRGCPYQCTFCSSCGTWTTRWIPRDPAQVVDEIELYMRRYGANDFHFEDLTAIVRQDWVLAFCEEIQRRNLKITYQMPAGTRSEAIDETVARAMHNTGCRQFTFAIETGSPEMLKKIKKQSNLDKMFEAARAAMKTGIRVQAAFIYGFPDETWYQMFQTYRTILKCAIRGFHEINIASLAPLPATEIYRELEQADKIRITDEYLDTIFGYMDFSQYKSWNPRLSDRMLRTAILFSYASFFGLSYLLRPTRAWRLLRGLFSNQTDGKFAKIIKGLIRNRRALKTLPTQGNTDVALQP